MRWDKITFGATCVKQKVAFIHARKLQWIEDEKINEIRLGSCGRKFSISIHLACIGNILAGRFSLD